MKKMAMLMALAVLAGCAATPGGLRMSDLRSPTLLRSERVIPLSFPKIQMALLKHQEACGGTAEFAMDARQTNYATILEKPAGEASLEHAVLADLTQYQGGFSAGPLVKTEVYTYYADPATMGRIDAIFDAIAHPGVCGQPK